jgi:hypothetical protein
MTSDGGLPSEDDIRRERAARDRTIEDHERRDPGCAWLTLAALATITAVVIAVG